MADSDTETQAFDSQPLSLSSSLLSFGLKPGNRRKDRIADEHQNIVPFHDTVELKSPSAEIQLKNSDAETEVMDVPDCVENMRTETIDDYEKEVVLDSDDEGMHRIEETSVMELSSSGSKRAVGWDALNMEKRQLTPLCEQDLDFVAGSVASARKQCYAGYIRRGVGSVFAHSASVSGFARRSMTANRSSNVPNSIQVDTHYEKQLVVQDNGTSRVDDQLTVDANMKGVQDHDRWKCNGKMSDFKDENKSGARVSKFFNGNTFDEKKVSSCDREATDGGEDAPLITLDQEPARLSYIESQESGELSRANALDFVDHYLSCNNVILFEEIAPLKTNNREKSPPVLNAKGAQSLARRANLRAVVGKSRTFEWDDNHINDKEGLSLGKKKELILDDKGHQSRSVTRPPSAGNMDVKKQENVDVQCKEMGSINLDSRLMLHDCNEISEAVQTSEMEIEKDFVKELNEQFDAESSGRQLETGGTEMDLPDTFDVGFNTQLAAEAMEALLYAPIPSPNFNADYAHQSPQITRKLSPNGPTERKAANCCSFRKICSNSGVTARKSRSKRSANKSNGDISSLIQECAKNLKESDPELPAARKVKKGKSLTENHLNCRNPANARKSLCGRSKSIHHGKEGALERDNIKVVGKNISSSISVEDNSLGNGCSRGKFRKISPIVHRTRHRSSVKSLERTENPINGTGERTNNVIEVGVPKKGRKRASLHADVFQVLSVGNECPKLGFNTSVGATNGKTSQQGRTEIDADVAVTASHLKLDSWSYPKGKRKSRNVPDHSSGASNLCALSTVSGEKSNYHSIESSKNSERNSKTTCFSLETLQVKKKSRSSVYTRQQCSLEKRCGESISRQNFDEPDTADIINGDYALMNNKKIPPDPDRAKTSWKTGKVDDVNSISFADGIKKSIILNENDNGSLSNCPNPITEVFDEASPIYKGDEDYKQPYKKKLSRSPLMKELIRLGIESLPNFVSKDLRRRRKMANARVLFSQNLDDDIIKQQKKVLARLGISTASCCSDATHFITDRFVRTRNMLEAIAFGKPVVTHLWLESCGQASCLIDEKNYILRDAKKEKEIGFSMPISLARASHHPLLKGKRVFITPNIKPGKELIACLVKAVHGQAVDRIQRAAMKDDEMTLDDLLILSCEQDYAVCVPFLEKGAAVYSSELLLNGIVIQKLEFERHQLFTDHVKRKCS